MAEREEIRKIQFTGRSSYIVSLPKQWILDLGLKRGDQIKLVRKNSSVLEIYPSKLDKKSLNKEEATIEIDVDENLSIVRKLISLYFSGYKIIHVKPKKGRINPGQRNIIKKAIKKMLMGSEIISDSSGGITIQVLVNLLELSIDGAFKRMIHLANSMSRDSILALKENNLELAQEVINTDDEVDRFGFYIIRQLKIAIENEHMLKEMGLKNPRNCLEYRLVVKNIERVGDHASFIANNMLEFKKPLNREILEKIKEMNDFSLAVLDSSCLALFKEDFELAEKTIQKTNEIAIYENKIINASKSPREDEEIYRVRRITENIRRISEYASDIAEIVLNMNIEKSLKKVAKNPKNSLFNNINE